MSDPAKLSLVDFLMRKPLTEEHAALMRGEDPDAAPPVTLPPAAPGALDDNDREWLRRLTVEPGWPILMRLLENAIEERQQRAIVLSQTDPIGNQLEITKAWTYVASMKEAVRIIRDRVQHQINLLCLEKTERVEVLGE